MGTCLPDLALKVRWLADKCKKGVTWEWNHEDTTRLGSLLGELEDSLVVRAIPDYSKPFVLRTDASDRGIGGYLFQKEGDDTERVIMVLL